MPVGCMMSACLGGLGDLALRRAGITFSWGEVVCEGMGRVVDRLNGFRSVELAFEVSEVTEGLRPREVVCVLGSVEDEARDCWRLREVGIRVARQVSDGMSANPIAMPLKAPTAAVKPPDIGSRGPSST